MRTQVSEYSALVGKNPLLVQGAGGNVSWKEEDTLWVKASGTWLADAEDKDIFVPVELPHLRGCFAENDFVTKPKVVGTSELRPSIETVLHALMPQTVVVHTHPIDIIAYLVLDECEQQLANKIGDSLTWGLVDYQKPGADLGEAVYRLLENIEAPPQVIFLANHGVIVGGETVEEVDGIYAKLNTLFAASPRACEFKLENELPEPLLSKGYQLASSPKAHALAFDPIAVEVTKRDWALYPDHVVFLGAEANRFNDTDALIRNLEGGAEGPDYAVLPGYGVLVKNTISANKLAMLSCFSDVVMRLGDAKGLNSLTEKDVGQLLNWEAEKYRSSISK